MRLPGDGKMQCHSHPVGNSIKCKLLDKKAMSLTTCNGMEYDETASKEICSVTHPLLDMV
jgi:hypothetical protein